MKNILLLSVSFFIVAFLKADTPAERFGSITGQIIDGTTQQPLVGANILLVEKPAMGTTTDENGNYTIKNIPVGEYSLRATLLGFQSAVVTNIVVSTGRSTKTKIRMYEEAVAVDEVVVNADYFSSGGLISPVSAIGLSGAEVKRSPGAVQDMQRIVQNLPGVANSNDQTNELIVRGGAPDENLTVMDYIEIPSTNHYPNQFNSGGPINMVNVDMIEDIRFSTGGFTARYGDKLSSVMDISLREGDKDRTIAGQAGFSMAGIGTLLEGGFDNGKGTWIFSGRQSLLEFADKIVGLSKIGLTAVPKYYDTQFKITYELSPTQKLMVNGIYGDDKIFFDGTPDAKNDQKINVIDSSGVEIVDFKSRQYAAGISLKSLWGESGFSVFSLYTTGNAYTVNENIDFLERTYGGEGEVIASKRLNEYTSYTNDSEERMVYAKYDAVWIPASGHEISTGGIVGTDLSFNNKVFFDSDTLRFDVDRNGSWDTVSTFYNNDADFSLKGFGQYKFGFYAGDKVQLSERLTADAGIRYDYFTYSAKGNIAPRLSVTYELQPMLTKLTAAYGEYYQTLSFPYYGDYRNTEINRHLDNSHARHFIFGIEHILGEGLKMSLEAYYKEYDHLPVTEQFINSADPAFRSDKVLSAGKRSAKGIDFFLQQKQAADYFGTLSFTYSKTTDIDPRKDLNGFSPVNVGSYPSLYDYPFLLTIVAGKRVKNTRTSLDDMPFYIKYPAMILPFSDDMELSIRFRYSSGKPYTPRIFNPYEQRRIGQIAWSKGVWTDGGEINSARHNDYQRFDIQWLSRWHNNGYNIVLFLEVENVYNHKNVAGYQFNSDGTKDIVYQYGFFPVGGINVEF